MKLKDLVILLKNATEQGASNALMQSGHLQTQVSKAEAYRLFGRGNVDRWISEKLICPTHCPERSSRKYLDRTKLEAIAASSNRITYLPVAER
ncbi:hypothetical protein AY601_2931 [Pedobacter cryoconitis]|uniref:Uncharacterized protein n=1 Tax=Pedobacter cryoconitis TaxID=188932 RepID=A0A127VEQ1_9SPHI|nr:hypothetical protein [Pedobacter cryoconitis]AMP99806.1 hypothetical protein AY601_2931 [Pedobacter cryoconitis]